MLIGLPKDDQWENLRSVGVVESTREVNGQSSTERRYFLTSLPPCAKEFAQAVRARWGIGNQLHWVLDVSLQEDQSRVRQLLAAIDENYLTALLSRNI